MTSLSLVTQMFSSSMVTGSHHARIKTHFHDRKFHPEFILQISTYIAPLQTGDFMEVQKVISKTHEGRMYYEHLRVKGIPSDSVNL